MTKIIKIFETFRDMFDRARRATAAVRYGDVDSAKKIMME